MTKDHHSPEDRVKALVAEFCEARLTPEYRDFAFHLMDLIRANPSLDLNRGRPEIWAAAIVSVIGRVNPAHYASDACRIQLQEVGDYFQVRSATAGGKASHIAQTLGLRVGHEGLSTRHMRNIGEVRERIGVIAPVSRSSVGMSEDKKRWTDLGKMLKKAARVRGEESRAKQRAERQREIEETKRLRQKAEEAQLSLFGDPSDKDA